MAFISLLAVFVFLGMLMQANQDIGRHRERRSVYDDLMERAKGADGPLKDRLIEAAMAVDKGEHVQSHIQDDEPRRAKASPYDFSEVGRNVFDVKLGSKLKGIVVREEDGNWLAYSIKNTSKPIGSAQSREDAAELLGI